MMDNSLTQRPLRVVEWKYLEDALIVDADGKIVHNAFQMDTPVIRKKFSDGVYLLQSAKTGKPILPPFRLTPDVYDMEPVNNPEDYQ